MAITADLVLEGGGVKGIALVGALSVLEEHGFTFHRIAGSSAGAIVGSLVAAGMTTSDMRSVMGELDYRRFCDETELARLPLIGRGLSLVHEHGVFAGDYFHGFIADQLANCGVRTFGDLRYTDSGTHLDSSRRFRLLVMASDVSRGRLLRLPWDYHLLGLDADDQLVADAVRASMSLPFLFRPYRLEVPGDAPSVLLDGGLLSNFPVDAFDRTDGRRPRWPTIGIKLVARRNPHLVLHEIGGDLSLALAMFETMMSWHDELRLSDPEVARRTIFVDTFGVKATDFDLDRSTQRRLYESGRAAAQSFLEGAIGGPLLGGDGAPSPDGAPGGGDQIEASASPGGASDLEPTGA